MVLFILAVLIWSRNSWWSFEIKRHSSEMCLVAAKKPEGKVGAYEILLEVQKVCESVCVFACAFSSAALCVCVCLCLCSKTACYSASPAAWGVLAPLESTAWLFDWGSLNGGRAIGCPAGFGNVTGRRLWEELPSLPANETASAEQPGGGNSVNDNI